MSDRFGTFERTTVLLGRGATAAVYVATDTESGQQVALKCYAADGRVDHGRLAREIAALQLLELPGVVRYLAHGVTEAGAPWVATERVRGRPFPAGRQGWAALEPVLRSLLTTLSQVHTVGIVHRDLKPSNVLVTDDDQVVVLDFGLARGTVLGPTLTQTDEMVGTPLYLAPEQLLGERVDGRADLYAVGVMVHEALAGEPPHQSRDLLGLWRERLAKEAPTLGSRCPELDPRVGEWVDRLLDRSPDNRPQTASAALAALGEPRREAFPWVGSDAVVDAAVAAARAGRPFTLAGGPGSGRTRALGMAVDRLRQAGSEVWVLRVGSGPYRSCAHHVSVDAAADAAEAATVVREAVTGFLAGGGVIAVDGADTLDVWTRRVLDGASGAILRTGSEGDGRLEPLEQADLKGLFWGPDRVWRLQSDGARELFRRSGGVPARVVSEVQAWIREGLVRWGPASPDPLGVDPPEPGIRLHIDRMAIDRLTAGLMPERLALTSRGTVEPELEQHLEWTGFVGPDATFEVVAALVGRAAWQVQLEREELVRRGFLEQGELGVRLEVAVPGFALWASTERRQAHRAVAEVLPPGSRQRLEHLAGAEWWSELVCEAALLGRRWADRGSNGLAIAVIQRAIRVLPEGEGSDLGPLVEQAARLAISLRDRATLRAVQALVPRVGPELADVGALLEGAVLVLDGKGDEARSVLDGIGPFADEETELCRHAQRVAAAALQPLFEAEALLDELDSELSGSGSGEVKLTTWKGLLAHRRGDYERAAEHHREALAGRSDAAGRLSSMLNLAASLLAANQLDAVHDVLRQAEDLCGRSGHLGYAGRLRYLRVACDNKNGACAPDLPLLRALPEKGDLAMVGAAIAVRGRHPARRTLLARARALNSGVVSRYAEALLAADEGDASAGGDLPAAMREDVGLVAAGRHRLPSPKQLYDGVFRLRPRPRSAS